MAEEFQEPTSLNVEEAVDSLLSQSVPEVEADQEDVKDQEEVEAADDDVEVQEDQPTEDDAEDASTETDEAEELYYEIDGEEVSAAQLKEWREGGMKNKDYTEKTQQLSEARQTVETDRIALNQERQAIQAERTQLQEALASMAISTEPTPDWVKLAGELPPKEFQAYQAQWNQREAQKQQAREVHQALQQQQHQQHTQREMAALLHVKPEWSDPAEQKAVLESMQSVGSDFGFQPDEIASISDHRMLLILDEVISLRAKSAKVEKAKEAVSKRVVKAEPRRGVSGKSPKGSEESKALKNQRAKFKGSRSVNDAADLLMAQLNS